MDDINGTVIDPYCGSGTTLVAAKLLGHKYIGIDISKEYCSRTQKRLENCWQEQEKLDKEITLHQVKETFKQRKQRGLYQNKAKHKNTKDSLFLFQNF